MSRVLVWLLRGMPEGDRQALIGDLDEEYRARVRPTRSWLGAEAWYAGQVALAAWSFLRKESLMSSAAHRPMMRAFDRRDIRYALRRWRRRPGFPLAATLTLGLGIGAATAMFSVVDAVLLQPLPWSEPDRLVAIHAVYPERRSEPDWNRRYISQSAWELLRNGSSFTDVAVWTPPSLSVTLDEGRTQIVESMRVSSNFLPLLGVELAHGRHFTREDDEEDRWNVILSYEAWERHFGGRPDIIGRPGSVAYATADTRTPPWTVVGVLARGFTFEGHRPAVLMPLGGNVLARRRFPAPHAYAAIGRLAPGSSADGASTEATALIQASQSDVVLSGRVVPLLEEQVGASSRPLWLLFGAAGVLLLVACANVAGLLVGENRARRHETAIRLALGITRGGVVRQLVVEHALLAMTGAAAGLLLAAWLTPALVALAPVELPRLDAVRVDWRVATFALGVGCATLLVFGLAPAVSLASTRAARVLTEGGREAAPVRHVAQRTVVAAEVAMAAILVVGAGLLGETLFRLTSQPIGFDPSNLVMVETRFTGSNIPADWVRGTRGPGGTSSQNLNPGPSLAERTAAIRRARTNAVIERLQAVPGVVGVTGVGRTLFTGGPASAGARIQVDGRPTETDDRAEIRSVAGNFAGTLGAHLLSGRDLTFADDRSAVLVSREFERRYFPDGAVGREFRRLTEVGYPPVPSGSISHRVVGVVADLRHAYVHGTPPAVYTGGEPGAYLVRTAHDPEAAVPAIRAAFAEVDPQIVVTATTTVASTMAGVIAAERFRATLSTAFAGTALLLSVVGLYGVAARRVADRRRELGIRVALGARPANLRSLIVRDGIRTVGIGLAAGLPAAYALSQLTRTFLFGVSPTAPHVFLLASLLLSAAAIGATYLPARRASRVDPMIALRE